MFKTQIFSLCFEVDDTKDPFQSTTTQHAMNQGPNVLENKPKQQIKECIFFIRNFEQKH